MRIRDSLFIIFTVALFALAVYFKLEISKLEDKNLELTTSKLNISDEFKSYKKQEIQKRFLQEKEMQKEQRERLVLEQKKLRIQKRRNLKIKVDTAFESAQKIYKKYRNTKCKEYIIKEALNQHLVFIKDYEGVVVGNIKDEHSDINGRAIGLEEIQKVRRHQEGFIKIKSADTNTTQSIYVKDLGMYDWYIGSSTAF